MFEEPPRSIPPNKLESQPTRVGRSFLKGGTSKRMKMHQSNLPNMLQQPNLKQPNLNHEFVVKESQGVKVFQTT